jgi:hypothetical protein
MWLKDMFANRKNGNDKTERDPMVNRGVMYLYAILGGQVLLVFGILAGIMVIGQVLATPFWVFLAAAVAGVWGVMFVYRKTVQQLQKVREAFSRMDLSGRNYEISIMGGVLTMRVEQNPQALLEAPSPAAPVIEAEPIIERPLTP